MEFWAAYVLGHHCHMLQLWHDQLLESVQFQIPIDGSRLTLVPIEIRELNLAMRMLVLRRQLDAAVLVEVHRQLDMARQLCRRLSWSTDRQSAVRKSFLRRLLRVIDRLIRMAPHLLAQTSTLHPWQAFGNAIGVCRTQLRLPGDASGPLEAAIESARALTSQHQFSPEDIIRVLEGGAALVSDPNFDFTSVVAWHNQIAQLDLQMQSELRDRTVPPPVLVLDKERLCFYGQEHELSDSNESRVLWILAESAGTLVAQSDIIHKRHVKTDINNVKYVIHRLRNLLKRLVGGFVPPPPGLGKGFILGKKGKGYWLDLDPSLVQVNDPPGFMQPKLKPVSK